MDDYSEQLRLLPDLNRSLLLLRNTYLGVGDREKAKADFDEYFRLKRGK